jgi:hypothetical protein
MQETAEDGLLLRVSYKTIFGQTVTAHAVFLIEYAVPGLEGKVWYPNRKELDKVQCVAAHPSLLPF